MEDCVSELLAECISQEHKSGVAHAQTTPKYQAGRFKGVRDMCFKSAEYLAEQIANLDSSPRLIFDKRSLLQAQLPVKAGQAMAYKHKIYVRTNMPPEVTGHHDSRHILPHVSTAARIRGNVEIAMLVRFSEFAAHR